MASYQVDGKPYSFYPSGPQKTITNTWVKPAFDNIEPIPKPKPPRGRADMYRADTGENEPRNRFALIAAVVALAAIVLATVMLI